jgi:hypothetical protein
MACKLCCNRCIRDMKKASVTGNQWKPAKWRNRCAWCTGRIPTDREVFGISITLRPEAHREVKPGTIEPLLLYKAGKTVPMMLVTEDSPARHAGKDAMFQLCSETCARALQTALRQELGETPS